MKLTFLDVTRHSWDQQIDAVFLFDSAQVCPG